MIISLEKGVHAEERETVERGPTLTDTQVELAPDVLPYPVPEAEAFEDTRGWLPADDLRTIAKQLVDQYPSYFSHLEDLFKTDPDDEEDVDRIVFAWNAKGSKTGWTKAVKGELAYAMPHAQYMIWLSAELLRGLQYTHRQVRAQVFHELCHITLDLESGKRKVTAEHDFEGFEAELLVFGPWTSELVRAKRTFAATPAVGLGPLFERDDDDE